MNRVFFIFLVPLLLCSAMPLQSQSVHPKNVSDVSVRDIDPLAIDVLHAVTAPLQNASAFSFKANVSEEETAASGQIVTFFHSVDVVVQRPGNVRLSFHGNGERVELFGTPQGVILFSPGPKLYTNLPSRDSLDAMLTALREKGVDPAIGPLLRSDLSSYVTGSLTTAYVVGRVNLNGESAHQLVFTAPDADWQLWVAAGDAPKIVRYEVVSKLLPGKPRTTVQLSDWNLSPTLPADEFTFQKPADAQKIDMLPAPRGN